MSNDGMSVTNIDLSQEYVVFFAICENNSVGVDDNTTSKFVDLVFLTQHNVLMIP